MITIKYNNWVCVQGYDQEQWFRLSDIVHIKVRSNALKPAGWPDCYKAVVILRGSDEAVWLSEEDWTSFHLQIAASTQDS